METKSSYSIIRLMAVFIIALTSFFAVSCDKDDDDPNQLVGLWELTWMDGVTTESYYFGDYFDNEGRGNYNGPYKNGSFFYIIESPGHIRFIITYHEKPWGGSYKDEFVWPYSIKGDKLTLDGKTYTRKDRE